MPSPKRTLLLTRLLPLLLTLIDAPAAGERPAARMTANQFRELMEKLATAWGRQDVDLALSCFTEDAVYMEPPEEQLFVGHRELRPYFGALEKGTFMVFHSLFFDEARQTGAGEFSFGTKGSPTADHGVILVELRDGRIHLWREYFKKGPADFQKFVARDGKKWKWTSRNYP